MVLLHALDSPLEAPRHIHEHKCASWWCDLNIGSIKRQKMVVMEKSRHCELMQVAGTHHINGTQSRMRYPNPNCSFVWVWKGHGARFLRNTLYLYPCGVQLWILIIFKSSVMKWGTCVKFQRMPGRRGVWVFEKVRPGGHICIYPIWYPDNWWYQAKKKNPAPHWPASTSTPWRMDGNWSGDSFLLGSSSLANHGG